MDNEEKKVIDSILLIENKALQLIVEAQKSVSEQEAKKEEAVRKAREREYKAHLDKEKAILENFEKEKSSLQQKFGREKALIEQTLGKRIEKNYRLAKDLLLRKVGE